MPCGVVVIVLVTVLIVLAKKGIICKKSPKAGKDRKENYEVGGGAGLTGDQSKKVESNASEPAFAKTDQELMSERKSSPRGQSANDVRIEIVID